MSGYWTIMDRQYEGLVARCAPGTHEAVADLLKRHSIASGAVLDLGAGSGALLARLRDAGFSDLSAVELDTDAFRLPGVVASAIDLNTDFAAFFSRQFPVVTAIEIMEHLDCPRQFLREIWRLLEPNGHLVLSAPNIAHWMGRVSFLTRGEMRYFKESDYHSCRHISPMNLTHLRLLLNEVGFRMIEVVSAGSFYGPVKRILTAPAAGLFRLLFGQLTSGDTLICLAQKAQPDSSSPGRSSATYLDRDRKVGAGAPLR